MKSAKTASKEARPIDRSPAAAPLDSGETRAVIQAAAGLVIFVYFIKFILLPFVLAAIVGYICTPLIDWLAARTRWPRVLFAVVLFLLIGGAAALALIFAATHLLVEVRDIGADLQGALEKLVGQALGGAPIHLFARSFSAEQIAQWLLECLRDWVGQAGGPAVFLGYGLGGVMGVFLTAVLLFYFLADGRRVARGLFWLVPPHRRALVERIWARLDPVLLRYFLGVLGVVAYATAAAYLGLGVILGIRHALPLALLTGILETLPVIGPTSAAVLAGLVALRSATGIMSVLAYALYAILLRLSIDQIVGPIVLGRAAHVHPVLVIFCFLAGGIVLGVPGVILGVPVALLVKSTLATLYGEDGR